MLAFSLFIGSYFIAADHAAGAAPRCCSSRSTGCAPELGAP